jgi:hypothetical protein
MKWWTPAAALAVSAAIVVAAAAPAVAKGADQATITGPGLAKPIVLTGMGEPGSGNSLGLLSEGSGMFVAMFGTDGVGPDLTENQPTAALGPKYEIAYRVPGGGPAPDILKQDLYPFADGGPVSYTKAGQAAMGGKTRGGWYRAPSSFRAVLTTIGIPDSVAPTTNTAAPSSPASAVVAAPQTRVDNHSSNAPVYVILAAVLLAAIAAAVLVVRRRPATR